MLSDPTLAHFTKNVEEAQWKIICLCRATVERQKDDVLSVTPEILCENAKEAEMLACTLALYHLCRGQVGLTCASYFWQEQMCKKLTAYIMEQDKNT